MKEQGRDYQEKMYYLKESASAIIIIILLIISLNIFY